MCLSTLLSVRRPRVSVSDVERDGPSKEETEEGDDTSTVTFLFPPSLHFVSFHSATNILSDSVTSDN